MKMDNIEMLHDTLGILEKGFYQKNGREVRLKLSRQEMEHVQVFLPDDIKEICSRGVREPAAGRCRYACEKMDSFALARKRLEEGIRTQGSENAEEILVLNFANPVNPGGGVRRGARAQEEDLCRKSSLLMSLESREAAVYYNYNKGLHTYMGSDAMIITPKVEIIKDENGELLDETVVVAVLTCAAPMITYGGKEGMDNAKYEEMVYRRIIGMLKCAAHAGYRNLILGAWGCGAFGNDAHMISDLFYKALKEVERDGSGEKALFSRVDFAVLSHGANSYNYNEFCRNFAKDNYT